MVLALGFFIVALIYSSVGFGGGSTYIALLALSEQSSSVVPVIALTCNILVVAIGSFMAIVRRGVNWRLSVPFFSASVPMAFVGGWLPLTDNIYFLLLAVSLLASSLVMMFASYEEKASVTTRLRWPLASLIGGFLGLLSGMVGIGGGIFLAPILHHLRWASAKTIAAICSVFILVNSIAGLSGQLLKTGVATWIDTAYGHLPLLMAVTIGGFLGARIIIEGINQHQVKRATSILIFLVGLRLLWQTVASS